MISEKSSASRPSADVPHELPDMPVTFSEFSFNHPVSTTESDGQHSSVERLMTDSRQDGLPHKSHDQSMRLSDGRVRRKKSATRAGRGQANTKPAAPRTLLTDSTDQENGSSAVTMPSGVSVKAQLRAMILSGRLHDPRPQRGIYHYTLLSAVVKPNKLVYHLL